MTDNRKYKIIIFLIIAVNSVFAGYYMNQYKVIYNEKAEILKSVQAKDESIKSLETKLDTANKKIEEFTNIEQPKQETTNLLQSDTVYQYEPKLANSNTPKINSRALNTLMRKLVLTIEENSIYALSEDELMLNLFKTTVAALHDEYSEYLTEEEYDEQTSDVESEYSGLGIDLEIMGNSCYIVNVLKNSAAFEAGLNVGDLVKTVNGASIDGDLETFYNVTETSRAAQNKNFIISVLRDGEEIEFKLVTKAYQEPDVTGYQIDKNTYYIDINTFAEKTHEHFKEELLKAKDLGVKNIIFDLRYNFGGYVDSATRMVSFLVKDKTIGYYSYMGTYEKIERCEEQILDLNYIILTNSDTVSSAEYFSDVLRTYGKATLVGDKTYGKGIVQDFFEFQDGYVKLTIAEFGATKKSNNKKGLEPDYHVKNDFSKTNKDIMLEKAISIAK